MKEAVEKFTTLLTEQGAKIVNEEYWGLKKLAYPIQKKSTGFINSSNLRLNLLQSPHWRPTSGHATNAVIRFLTFRQDKFVAAYAEKRRSLKSNANKEVKEDK